jgi:dTDP-glucose pyrophosphorylase
MFPPLNIVVPMAGLGSRFAQAGYTLPKPLIPVLGVPMIQLVIENIRPLRPHRFIFICQRSHVTDYDLASKLDRWAPGCAIVQLDGLTEGAACTVLGADAIINSQAPLMIANSDQFVDYSIDRYLAAGDSASVDGLIMTMTADDPKWSFVGFADNGRVNRVVEKQVISNEATVGIYNFRAGKDFVEGAREMIRRDLRVNNEFYVAPVYNLLLEDGYNICAHNIGSDRHGMHGLGTPVDLDHFLTLAIARRAIGEV